MPDTQIQIDGFVMCTHCGRTVQYTGDLLLKVATRVDALRQPPALYLSDFKRFCCSSCKGKSFKLGTMEAIAPVELQVRRTASVSCKRCGGDGGAGGRCLRCGGNGLEPEGVYFYDRDLD